jgi:hypothetical protein
VTAQLVYFSLNIRFLQRLLVLLAVVAFLVLLQSTLLSAQLLSALGLSNHLVLTDLLLSVFGAQELLQQTHSDSP